MKGPYSGRVIPVEGIDGQSFWARIQWNSDTDDSCWIWRGPVHSANGRPRPYMFVNGRRVSAKRIAWVLSNHMQVPPGKVVSQNCGNPLCMKPGHLEANSQSVAVSRGYAAKQGGAA